MNLVELCATVADRCGITVATGTFDTAQNQTGELLQVVNWVKQSWQEIQLSNANWDWMRGDFQFVTEAGKQGYTIADTATERFARWIPDSFRLYKTATGKTDDTFLTEGDWTSFRDVYMFGVQTPNKPSEFAIRRRDKALYFGPIPDDVYTVYGEYHKSSTSLVDDDDVPEMPEDFHMLIVHRARMKYAGFENAAEVFAEAQADYEWLMGKLVEQNIDEVGLGVPLA